MSIIKKTKAFPALGGTGVAPLLFRAILYQQFIRAFVAFLIRFFCVYPRSIQTKFKLLKNTQFFPDRFRYFFNIVKLIQQTFTQRKDER